MSHKISFADVYDVNRKTGALILGKNRLDDYALKFLNKHCPEALKTPMPLPVDDIVEKLGLKVKQIPLSKNLDIFGCCVLVDGFVEVYDRVNDKIKEEPFPAGTVLIDPDSEWAYGEGAKRNTLIHEALHWEKDKVFFNLLTGSKNHEDEKIFPIMCRQSKVFYEPPEGKKTRENQLRWLEWQANRLAPRVLMPRNPFKKKALEFIHEIASTNNTGTPCDTLVEKLSEFFIVSRTSVKYRLVEVGLEAEISKYDDYDDVYESINNSQDYVQLTLEEAWDFLKGNTGINEWISEHRMVFVDGYFVLPSTKYIRFKEGIPHLTVTAKKSLPKCVLNVREHRYIEYKNAEKDLEGCAVLYRVEAVSKSLLVCHPRFQKDFEDKVNLDPNEVYDAAFGELKASEDEEAEKQLERMLGDPDVSLCQCINFLMQKRKWKSSGTFSDKTHLHENYFGEIKKDKKNNMTAKILMPLCVGLQLSFYTADRLFMKAGIQLRRFQKPDKVFIRIMERFPGLSINDFNALLEREGVSTLGTEERIEA